MPAGCSSAAAQPLTGTAIVIDGDTLALGDVTVRINGIAAAELGQKCDVFSGDRWACDDAAAVRLAELVDGVALKCRPHDTDAYGRTIATCFADGLDVGRQLVGEGLAWAFVKYDLAYVDHEAEAKAAGLGTWRAAGSTLGLPRQPLGERR